MMNWLEKEKLPANSEAAEMLMNEAEFVRFQNLIWMHKDKYRNPVPENVKEIYDGI